MLNPQSNSSVPQLKKVDGSVTEYGQETAEYLLNYLFPDDAKNDETLYHESVRNRVKDYLKTVSSNHNTTPIITMNELKCIFEWEPYKAAPDYQRLGSQTIQSLLKIINLLRELEASNCNCNSEKQQERS